MSDESPDLVASEGRVVEPSKEARNWATLCHLSGGLGVYLGVGHILGPLLIWLFLKNDYPFVDDQGKEALNFQISMTLYLILGFISMIACVGFVLVPVLLVTDLILMVIAAIKTSNGERYRYPLTIRLVR